MTSSMNKKRRKSSRMRGSHTHGRGFKKKARGSGHRGGFGMAGTGKRADHRKSFILNLPEEYFGKSGLNAKPKKYKVINIEDLEKFAKGKEVDLKNYKILGNGEIKTALTVYAKYASASAIEKIERAGGKVILSNKPFEAKDKSLTSSPMRGQTKGSKPGKEKDNEEKE